MRYLPSSPSTGSGPPGPSIRRIFLPCFELLCTNMFSEYASPGSAGSCGNVVEIATWNLRISRGFPAFLRQFWLHLRKNFNWYLENNWQNQNRRSKTYTFHDIIWVFIKDPRIMIYCRTFCFVFSKSNLTFCIQNIVVIKYFYLPQIDAKGMNQREDNKKNRESQFLLIKEILVSGFIELS